jgi:ATP-dependent HslUV protease ATP-binding subunit HslU
MLGRIPLKRGLAHIARSRSLQARTFVSLQSQARSATNTQLNRSKNSATFKNNTKIIGANIWADNTQTRKYGVELEGDVLAKPIPAEAQSPPTLVEEENNDFRELSPPEIVAILNQHIVGQDEAKKAVAIAMRNRWRRKQLPKDMRDEIIPKNILMIGPTGVGKTEVARRLAKLIQAPFIKVEATKYTEVGFRGKDVDSIVQDLVEVGLIQMKEFEVQRIKPKIKPIVEERLLDLLTGTDPANSSTKARDHFRTMLRAGHLESVNVDISVSGDSVNHVVTMKFNPATGDFEETKTPPQLIKQVTGAIEQKTRKSVPVKEARKIIEDEEIEKKLKSEDMVKKTLRAVEQDGVVFIDEIDKICGNGYTKHHAEASTVGVQRDLLPLIEGTTVTTKRGNVDTSKILFIASGAFHYSKPSDLLAELQGRLPIRVTLSALTQHDLYRILTEPQFNLLKQQVSLMKTEGIELTFTEDSIQEIARIAYEVNQTVENIGARRLHTVIEKIMEDFSYDVNKFKGKNVVVDAEHVKSKLSGLMAKANLRQSVL